MKFLRLLLILCLVAGVILAFASCDKETEPTSPSTSSTEDNSAPSTTDSSKTDNSSTDDNKNDEPKMVDYTVRAIDPFGNPLEVSVNVEMFKDGESLGEMPIRRGAAIFRLEEGYYTFEVKPMEGEFYYDKSACVFDEETTDITVTLYNYANNDNKQTIWIYDENVLDHVPYDAVQVEEGGAYVEIDRPEMTYFIFTPTRGGIYKISYESSKAVTIGYFGSPHNVLINCPIDVINGAFELEVKNEGVNIGNEGGTTQLVFGIRSYTVKGCVLKIERVGDAKVDLPWTDIMPDKSATKVDNCLNSEFVSAFFIGQLSHPYMTTGKTIALTRWTFVAKVMSLLLNMLSRLVITFLPRSKCFLISWLQSPSAVIKSATVSTVSPSICHEVMGPDAMILVF